MLGSYFLPLLAEEVICVFVTVSEEEDRGGGGVVGEAFVDEAADGSDACACGHGYEGTVGVDGAVDGG